MEFQGISKHPWKSQEILRNPKEPQRNPEKNPENPEENPEILNDPNFENSPKN